MSAKRVNPKDIEIGKRIRLQRMALGTSQTELGVAVGVTFQQIQKYEKGMNRVGGSRIAQLATALEVEPAYFFGDQHGNGNGRKSNGNGAEAALESLVEPGAYKMVQSFNQLNPRLRRALRDLMMALAAEERAG